MFINLLEHLKFWTTLVYCWYLKHYYHLNIYIPSLAHRHSGQQLNVLIGKTLYHQKVFRLCTYAYHAFQDGILFSYCNSYLQHACCCYVIPIPGFHEKYLILNMLCWAQCPPFRLSYQGLGEPLCFAAFGPFATTAFYLLQGSTRWYTLIHRPNVTALDFIFPCLIFDLYCFDSEMNNLPLTGPILSAALLVGLTTALILFCSHFHQVIFPFVPLIIMCSREQAHTSTQIQQHSKFSFSRSMGITNMICLQLRLKEIRLSVKCLLW